MPTLAELRRRTSTPEHLTTPAVKKPSDEILIRDTRSQLRPAHVVEQKLTVALRKSNL